MSDGAPLSFAFGKPTNGFPMRRCTWSLGSNVVEAVDEAAYIRWNVNSLRRSVAIERAAIREAVLWVDVWHACRGTGSRGA